MAMNKDEWKSYVFVRYFLGEHLGNLSRPFKKTRFTLAQLRVMAVYKNDPQKPELLIKWFIKYYSLKLLNKISFNLL